MVDIALKRANDVLLGDEIRLGLVLDKSRGAWYLMVVVAVVTGWKADSRPGGRAGRGNGLSVGRAGGK